MSGYVIPRLDIHPREIIILQRFEWECAYILYFGNQRLVWGEPNIYQQVNGSRNYSTILQRATKPILVFSKQRTYYPVARSLPLQGRYYIIPVS